MSFDDTDKVTIPHRADTTFVMLHGCNRPHDDALTIFGVQAEAHGLTASIWIETIHGDGLDEFVRRLDDDFRGWPGERIWTSSRKDLEVRARHLGAWIRLSWILRFPEPTVEQPDWETTIHLHVNPGEELRDLSGRITAFLRP